MTILDAQSKDAPRARTAIMGLLSRGAYIKASNNLNGRSWGDFHLVISGQRHEANRIVLKGIAESGKVTIVNYCKEASTRFYGSNLSMKGRYYTNEDC